MRSHQLCFLVKARWEGNLAHGGYWVGSTRVSCSIAVEGVQYLLGEVCSICSAHEKPPQWTKISWERNLSHGSGRIITDIGFHMCLSFLSLKIWFTALTQHVLCRLGLPLKQMSEDGFFVQPKDHLLDHTAPWLMCCCHCREVLLPTLSFTVSFHKQSRTGCSSVSCLHRAVSLGDAG